MKLFIIHGWTYSLDKWTDVTALLKTKGFEPVLLRVPGLTTPSDNVWDIDSYVQWLDGQLEGESSPIVVGHSNGGRIALAFTQAHPNVIKQLILIDSAGLAHAQLLPRTKLAILRVISFFGKPIGRVPLIRRLFYKLIGAQDYNQAPPNMKQTMRHMLEADKHINLSTILTPVTIIWGKHDTITPLKDGQTMQRLLPNATLHIIEGARHAPQATHPEEVATLIKQAVKG